MILIGIRWLTTIKNDHLITKIKTVMSNHGPTDLISYASDISNIFIGKTSNHFYQGDVILSPNRVLVGRVFEKDTSKPINKNDFDQITIEQHERLIHYYWGNYISIIEDAVTYNTSIIVDPIGRLPLFYYESNEFVLFASDINLINSILAIRFNINIDYCVNFLFNGEILSTSTPFTQINSVLPGTCLNILKKGLDSKLLWNPSAYALHDTNNFNYNEEIVSRLNNVLTAWCHPYQSILLDFSGGLDSTSLLYSLNHINTNNKLLTPVNLYHPKIPSSNELFHARKISEDVGLQLHEFDCTNSLPLEPLKNGQIKPNRPCMLLTHLKRENDLFRELSHQAQSLFVSGHGGDSLFMCPPFLESITDMLLAREYNGVYQKIIDIATYFRYPLIHILKNILTSLYAYGINPLQLLSLQYNSIPWLKIDTKKYSFSNFLHPFFLQNKKLSPAKYMHIYNIYSTIASISENLRNPHVPIFYPLLTQPLIELALSIPCYETFANGYDRIQLRTAIDTFYKAGQNVWRSDKGETSGIFHIGLQQNKTYVLELCLEGYLSRNNLIDKNLLYQQIHQVSEGLLDNQKPLAYFISLEIFLNEWGNAIV